ncbi:alpha/beta-hydrolase [Sporormia fimetaria CBS 119925]|uniref:Alpha/beta-hydrolase n=1 Tax=Sporormia fimetaria CBS 119925 TaxID=1340428 RepID=A0A6A6V817_9PLEO|nr:alpha/beta-hydrolase [Sporormia fimetaria CBS 119925]
MFGELALRGLCFVYGLFSLAFVTAIAAVRDGAFSSKARMSEEEEREFALAQKKYWDLSAEPLPGFRHAFYTLRNGLRLHYVINESEKSVETKKKGVAIFIHGFPDSYLLWRELLVAPSLQGYTMIAVDLPSYGGSDNFSLYDANNVLEAMTGFILGMRDLYLTEASSRLVIISHDWGSLIGARLASEAKELAHRWILTSGVIPHHASTSALTLLASTKQMLLTYRHHPTNLHLLKTSLTQLLPLLAQANLSFYIFILNLPLPLATFFARMGNFWFLRLTHHLQTRCLFPSKVPTPIPAPLAADHLAASSGPGTSQLPTSTLSQNAEEEKYPPSVRNRVRDHGMAQKIRLYREGLFLGPWEKSLETIAALSAISVDSTMAAAGAGGGALFDEGPEGALKVPATLIHGEKDPAFERRLVLSGLGDYLPRRSQAIMLEGSGHWLPTEEFAGKVIVEVAEWALGGEEGSLRERLQGMERVTFAVDKQ